MSLLRDIDQWDAGTWVGAVVTLGMLLFALLLGVAILSDRDLPMPDCTEAE